MVIYYVRGAGVFSGGANKNFVQKVPEKAGYNKKFKVGQQKFPAPMAPERGGQKTFDLAPLT